MNIPVIKSLSKKYKCQISDWLLQTDALEVHYPDNIRIVVAKLMEDFLAYQLASNKSMPQFG
jgi:hypothetical protein